MANQTSTSGYGRAWERRRNLHHAVLLPLTESGTAKWEKLYSHIMVESDGTAKITASGMEQLKGPSA